jgi:hypothetical protein
MPIPKIEPTHVGSVAAEMEWWAENMPLFHHYKKQMGHLTPHDRAVAIASAESIFRGLAVQFAKRAAQLREEAPHA